MVERFTFSQMGRDLLVKTKVGQFLFRLFIKRLLPFRSVDAVEPKFNLLFRGCYNFQRIAIGNSNDFSFKNAGPKPVKEFLIPIRE